MVSEGVSRTPIELQLHADVSTKPGGEGCQVKFTLKQAGSYLVHVRFVKRHRPFPGSPIALRVLPAAPSPQASRLELLPSELTTAAGEGRTLSLSTFDLFGMSSPHLSLQI